ncbi:MAG: tagatose 1,6-diphosphate aldolase [bacterium]|nr:tagatose 1,6-diphosphate aldolase [bacterium]
MTVQTITPGRWQGLKRTSAEGDIFTIVAFDQRGTYRRMLPEGTSYETAVEIKSEVVGALSRGASAVLLDNEYGLLPALYMSRTSGLLLAIEKSGYSGDATYRRMEFEPEWTVEKIKRMGGTAVKLLAYYHPHTGELAEEIEDVIRQVAAECHKHDLPIFLEPLAYSLDANVSSTSAEFAVNKPQIVRETAQRLSKTGVDVLKMEFPVDVAHNSNRDEWRAACEALSEVSDIPWVLLSAGVEFETFAEQTRIACEAGASGFLAGRAIWKEAVTMTPSARENFLRETALPRLEKLNEIATQFGRSWTTFYHPPAAESGWYKSY